MAATAANTPVQLGTDRRQRRFSFSGAGRRAQPGHRNGGDRDSRRGFAGARARRAAAALGEPGRAEPRHRIAAPGRREARGDGRAGEAQQDFQRDPAGLAAGEAAFFAAREKYRLADRRGGARAGRRRHRAGGFDEISGPLLPAAGVSTRRAPDESEAADIAYGRRNRAADCRARPGPDGGGSRSRLRGRSKPWKEPTRPSNAPRASPAANGWWW